MGTLDEMVMRERSQVWGSLRHSRTWWRLKWVFSMPGRVSCGWVGGGVWLAGLVGAEAFDGPDFLGGCEAR